jgi:hypothetical protein
MENFLKQFFFDCSLLKILSMNKFTGVLGVYNCQGAACSSTEIKNAFHQTTTETLTGTIRGHDVHLIIEAATDSNWCCTSPAWRPFGDFWFICLLVLGSRHLVFTWGLLGNPDILVFIRDSRVRNWLWLEKVLTPLTHPTWGKLLRDLM